MADRDPSAVKEMMMMMMMMMMYHDNVFIFCFVYLRKGAAAVCVFCAGSNVTGLLADVGHLTSLAHQYGHLAQTFRRQMKSANNITIKHISISPLLPTI